MNVSLRNVSKTKQEIQEQMPLILVQMLYQVQVLPICDNDTLLFLNNIFERNDFDIDRHNRCNSWREVNRECIGHQIQRSSVIGQKIDRYRWQICF